MNHVTHLDIKRESARLILKTLKPEDVSPAYLSWLQDPEVLQYLEIRHLRHDEASTIEFVQKMLESPENLLMAIYLKADGRHIGNIKLGPINWRYKRADIGLLVGDKSCWGQGYATEAIHAICKVAFADLGLNRVQAGCYAGNVGSMKAFEKAGFTKEAVLKEYWFHDGQAEDEILLARLASDQATV